MDVRRRLAAVLAADVVGYSRLMGQDERGTYERLKALRRNVVEPAIAEYDGRIVKLMGDGLLAEFASAVNALECALAIQRGMAAENTDLPDDRHILIRIGVNVGDILVEGRDIHGDGVNVAARLEALGRARRDLHLRRPLSSRAQQDRRRVRGPRRASAEEHRRDEAEAHYVQGIIHLWHQKDPDQAIADAERAIALDPGFARGYGSLGAALHYAGRSEEALERFETMVRLDPHCPGPYQHFLAQAHFALGHFEEASAALKTRLAQQPHSDISRVLLAACYGYRGRAEEARAEWQEALRINPDYSIEHRRQILPYKNPADFERVVEGLRKAGIAV